MSDIGTAPARDISVTIKYGKDEPWVVFRGRPSEIREDLLEVFGFAREDAEGLTLSEIVVTCQKVATGKATIVRELDATPTGTTDVSPSESAEASSSETTEDVWAAAKKEPDAKAEEPAKPHQAIYDAIEAETDVKALKVLWGEHQEAFTDDADLLAAWKAKGKALKAAAK